MSDKEFKSMEEFFENNEHKEFSFKLAVDISEYIQSLSITYPQLEDKNIKAGALITYALIANISNLNYCCADNYNEFVSNMELAKKTLDINAITMKEKFEEDSKREMLRQGLIKLLDDLNRALEE